MSLIETPKIILWIKISKKEFSDINVYINWHSELISKVEIISSFDINTYEE